MIEQELDQLFPEGLVAKVDGAEGLEEPNPPGTDDRKHLRLRRLLWSGPWKRRRFEIIAWDEEAKCWRCWERQ